MNIDWKKQTILITGASSGLGRAIALEAGRLGANCLLVARDEERLDEVGSAVEQQGARAHTFSFDLHQVDRIPEFYSEITEETGLTPTILINNAGYNATGFVFNTPIPVFEESYKANLIAPIALIQACLPGMLESGWGCIVDILGAANYHSFPANAAYCSSKSALLAVHESLQTELDGLPVQTLMVNPGSISTHYNRNRILDGRVGDYTYGDSGKHPKPDGVAKTLFPAIEKERKVLDRSKGLDRLGPHLTYFFPRLVDYLLVRRNKKLLDNRPLP